MCVPSLSSSSSSPPMTSLEGGSEESDQVIGEEPHEWGQQLHKELWGSTFVATVWEHWKSGSLKPPRRPMLEPSMLALCPWTSQARRSMENKFLLCRIWTSPRNIPEQYSSGRCGLRLPLITMINNPWVLLSWEQPLTKLCGLLSSRLSLRSIWFILWTHLGFVLWR